MKRFIMFIMVFVMIMGTVALAAPGDIIHVGQHKVYKQGSDEFVQAVISNADNVEFLKKFYREIEPDGNGVRRFVNLVAEEEAQFEYIQGIIKDPTNNITSPDDLLAYMEANKDQIEKDFEMNAINNSKPFDDITGSDKGNIGDYSDGSKAPKLKIGDNYSTPVLGYANGTTKIVSLTKPGNLEHTTSWVYKVGAEEDFAGLKIDDLIADTKAYSSGVDIPVKSREHLLLGLVDKDKKLKAYASIGILDSMIKTKVDASDDLDVTFEKSTKNSGATTVSGDLGDGTWRIAIPNNIPEVIYKDTKFNNVKNYVSGMELVLASDSELDNELSGFKKEVIVYKEKDELIEEYRVFELTEDNVSGLFDAPKFGEDGVDDPGLSLEKGASPGTTKVVASDDGTFKGDWMYAILNSEPTVPKQGRKYPGSSPYKMGDDISVDPEKSLMILATDGDKVLAYEIIEVDPGQVQDPLATILKEIENYSMPESGTVDGTTSFQHLNYAKDGNVKELYYEISDKHIPTPVQGSDKPVNAEKVDPKNEVVIFPSDDPMLKDKAGFTMYMMVYAVEGGKVIASTHENFIMTPGNVKLPDADLLDWEHYKESEDSTDANTLEKGTSANSTILNQLNKNGIPGAGSLSYKYTFVDEDFVPEINQILQPISNLKAGVELKPANLGEYLLILLVDSGNRTKYYAKVELTKDNIRVGDAKPLKLGDNFSNPEPGNTFKSTKFKLLGFKNIEGATEFRVAISSEEFKPVAFDSEVTGAFKYATVDASGIKYENIDDVSNENGNIIGVDHDDVKFLQLLATDDSGHVKGYMNFTLRENMIHGKEAPPLTSINYSLGKGSLPGSVKFTMLSPFNINNSNWMYKWLPTDEFTSNPPFMGQIIDNNYASRINTKSIGPYEFEALDDIKVREQALDNYGYLLLLATNGNRVMGYAVIDVKKDHVQSTATPLQLDLKAGSTPDSVEIVAHSDVIEENKASELAKSQKYMISTTPFLEEPGPDADLPRSGVKDLPENKEITVSLGEYLRIYHVDGNKIKGFKDIEIKKEHIKQGKVTMSILKPDGAIGDSDILEGKIKAESITISLALKGASWADVINNTQIKSELLDGFKADGEEGEWAKVMALVKNSKFSISKSITEDSPDIVETLTIITSATGNYDISETQNIKLTVPARAIIGAINPIEADGVIVIKPTIDAKISGSVVNNIRQSEINSGKATIIIDIVDSKWVSNIESAGNKEELLKGFNNDPTNDTPHWSLKSTIRNEDIRKTGPSRLEITIPTNVVGYESPETTTLEIPSGLVDGEVLPIIAAPAFTIYPDILPVKAEVNGEVVLEAPANVNALKDEDTWTLNLTDNTFRDDFLITRDISISTLPSGLKLDIAKVDKKQLSIKLVGKASKELNNGNFSLILKSSGVIGPNYSDSKLIDLPYRLNDSKSLESVDYEIKDKKIYLVVGDSTTEKDLQYSINSTTGTNGTWDPIPTDKVMSTSLEPLTIHVSETKQPGNWKLVGKLVKNPAPTDVEISNYSYVDGSTITLNKDSGLQYNLGKPDKWEAVPEGAIITLNNDSTLKVRYKEVPKAGEAGGKLPSLATPKLNGVFLGDVKLDVSQSKIIGATKDMKYRLANDGTWNSINANDPVVAFKDGNEVWISDAKNEINNRSLGTISQAKFDPDTEEEQIRVILPSDAEGKTGISYDVSKKEIYNKTKIDGETINLQYNITKGAVPTGNWFSLKDTAENVNFVPGSVFVRKVDDGNSLPSNPIKIFEIAEAINPPKIEVSLDSKTLLYEDAGGAYKDLDGKFEYRINNGDYQNGGLLKTDPSRFGNVTVYVKRKATQNLLASKEVNFKFTENISLANVRVNVAEGTIEGTTTKMEYRTDANSPWKIASNTKTSINMYEGMSIWIRELGTTTPVEKLITDIKKMGAPEEEPKGDLNAKWLFEYNVSQKFIKNGYGNILEYRINNDSWKTINAFETISIEFTPAKLSIRTKATADKLASDAVDIMTDLKYPDTAPVVAADDKENKVIFTPPADTSWKDYEFKLKTDTEWMPGTILENYIFDGDKVVQIRKKGSAVELPSEIREVIFTKNIDVTKVELREGTPLRLLKTEPEMEYQVYLNDKPIPNTWIKASAGTTNLDSKIIKEDVSLIVVRDSRNKKIFKVLEGTKKGLPVDLSKISYEITEDGIGFTGIKFDATDGSTGIDNTRLQYQLSSSSKLENFVQNHKFPLEVMETTIQDIKYPLNTRTIMVSERAEEPKVTVSEVAYAGDDITIKLNKFDKETMQYVIKKDDNWTTFIGSGSESETVKISRDDIIGIRTKAIVGGEDKGKLPSTPILLNTTSLIDVGIRMDNPKLTNTTELMEYSLDSSNGKDGSWGKANNGDTPLSLKLDTVIWIREIKNTGNVRKIGPIKQAPIPDLTKKVYVNIAKKKIANFTDQILEYRIAGGSWQPLNEDLKDGSMSALDIEFKPGNLEFRNAAKGSNFASKPIIYQVIKAPAAKPNVSIGFDLENYENIISGNLANLEYSFGANGPWTDIGSLDNGELVKDIYIRTKATTNTLPSSSIVLNFKPVLNLKVINYSDHVQPLELNGTTKDMEYMINDSKIWLDCTEGNTKLQSISSEPGNIIYLNDKDAVKKIEIRDKNQHANTVTIHP